MSPTRRTSDQGARNAARGTERSTRGSDEPRPLTDRQLEILGQVARGRTNRQVGEALGISERTVRNHLRTISRKLAATDRTHAVVVAIGRGWIAVPIEPDEAARPVIRPKPKGSTP